MWKVVLRGITQRKRRLVSTVLAVVIGVGFIVGVFVLSDTIRQTFNDLFSSVYRGTDVVVTGKGQLDSGFRQTPKRLPASLLVAIRAADGVDDAQGYVQNYAQVVGHDGTAVGGSNAPTFGASWSADQRVNPFTIASGHAPQADNEITVDRNTAKLGKLHVGDVVSVLSPSAPATYHLVGLTRFGSADSPAGSSFVHFTAPEADRIFQTNGEVDQILIVAKPGVTQATLKSTVTAITAATSVRSDVFTGVEATAKRQSEFQKNLKGFTTFLLVFAIVALVVATFVIFNTFQILLAQRVRELALLRAIGASARQVLRSVLFESLIVGFVAAVLGVVGGLAIAFGLKVLLTAIGFPLRSGGLVLLPRSIVVGLATGMAATVLAATLPAFRAARIPPIAALQEAAIEQRRPSRIRAAIGVALLVLAAVLLVRGLGSTGNTALARIGLSAGSTIFALLALNPLVLVPFTRSIGRVLHLKGVTGQIAAENVVRSPRRNALTAFPLLFGAALVGLLLVFAASFKAQVGKTIDGQFKGDFFITAKNRFGFSPDVADKVRAVPGVSALTPVRFDFSSRVADPHTGKRTEEALVAVDTSSVLQTLDIPTSEGSITDITTGKIGIDDVTARDLGVHVGDLLTVEFKAGGDKQLPIAAIIPSTKVVALFQGASFLIDLSTWDANYTNRLDALLYVKIADRNKVASMQVALKQALTSVPTAEVGDLASYKRLVDRQVAPFLNFVIGLLFISVLIATVGVANTMKLSVAERTREIGLLRAVGMNRRQSRAMVRWEAIAISVFGVLLGAAMGVGFGLALMHALRSQGFTEAVVPVRQFVAMTIVAALLGVVAASGAARRVARLDVLQAIAIQ